MWLAYLLQFMVWLGDILTIAALCIVFHLNWIVGLIAFILISWSQRSVGGWTFAWRPTNIRGFFANWRRDVLNRP